MSQVEATSNSAEIKSVALTIVELKESMSQLVKIQLNRKILKLHRNLLEGFGVALKVFFGLVMLNKCQAVLKKK